MREVESVGARKAAGEHGDSEGIEEAHAKGEHGDGVRAGKEEGHVSETELLIAHVLAAMKDCSLLGKEDKSSSSTRTLRAATQKSSQEGAGVWTSSRSYAARAARTSSSSEAHAAASTSSSSASTSSQVEGAASSPAEMAAQTPSQAHVASQSLSQAHLDARSSSQVNAAALCIASLKHTHNKENYVPSNRSLDMQDERAQPKFRNLADLYKLGEP